MRYGFRFEIRTFFYIRGILFKVLKLCGRCGDFEIIFITVCVLLEICYNFCVDDA